LGKQRKAQKGGEHRKGPSPIILFDITNRRISGLIRDTDVHAYRVPGIRAIIFPVILKDLGKRRGLELRGPGMQTLRPRIALP